MGIINSDKYVFRGLSDIIKHKIITRDDYKSKQIFCIEPNINIYIYNISKFDKENANIRKLHKNIGDSFFLNLSKEEIKAIAVEAINKVVKHKKAIIENVEQVVEKLCDVSNLNKEKERAMVDLDLYAEMQQNLIDKNTRVVQNVPQQVVCG